jgi:hypothetical protein
VRALAPNLRLRTRSIGVIATLGACGVLASPSGAALPAGCSQSGITVTCEFMSGSNPFTVPDRVSSIHVVAVGGMGGPGAFDPSLAAHGATVSGDVTVTPGSTLYAVVGTNGGYIGSQPGQTPGGANGGSGATPGAGASDVRASQFDLSSRLLVAGGGGGSGVEGIVALLGTTEHGFCGQPGAGGAGGGAAGQGATSPCAGGGGSGGAGQGGGASGGSGGAGGGSSCTPSQSGPFCPPGASGTSGGFGGGGDGGAGGGGIGGGVQESGGGGGGGGGGWFGGGGGGGGGAEAAGGGGGGGSNLVPPGGSASIDTTGTPIVQISYTVPQLHTTSTGVSCSPQTVAVGQPATCTAVVMDNGGPVSGQPVDAVNYSGTLSAPPATCPAVDAQPPNFLIDGGGAPLTSGDVAIAASPTQESVTGAGHDLDTDFVVSVQAGPNGQGPTGSLTLNGFFTFTATPTCLNISGNRAVTGYRIDSSSTPGVQPGQGFLVEVTDNDSGERVTPTGMMSFASDGPGGFGNGGQCALSGAAGSASCQVTYTPSALGSGTQVITGSYGGDVLHDTSGGTTDLTVSKRSTSAAVTCSPATFSPGDATTCTATIADTAGGAPATPAGSINFASSGNGTFAGDPCTLTGTSATSSCAVTFTSSSRGAQMITASYGGDGTHIGSGGATRVMVAVPTSTSGCVVIERGRITALNGDPAIFKGLATASPASGAERYRDEGPAAAFRLHSLTVDALTCAPSAGQASIFGTASIGGAGSLGYRIDLVPAVSRQGLGSYRIRLENGYDSGAEAIRRGVVIIHIR